MERKVMVFSTTKKKKKKMMDSLKLYLFTQQPIKKLSNYLDSSFELGQVEYLRCSKKASLICQKINKRIFSVQHGYIRF